MQSLRDPEDIGHSFLTGVMVEVEPVIPQQEQALK